MYYNYEWVKDKTDQQKGVVALLLLAVVFASMGLFARYLATGFVLFQQVYLRMLAAFVIGCLAFGKQIDLSKFGRLSMRDWLIIAFRAVSYSLFGIILFTQAIIITKYSNVSFIGALPMTAVLGFVLLREKITVTKLAFVLLSLAGVLLISVKDYSNVFSWGQGEILTLISTLFFALSYIARKWQTNFLNNKELTVVNFFVAFLVVFLVSVIKGDGLPMTGWNFGLMIAVAGAGIFNIMNVFLTNYGFQKVEAVLAGNILTLESVLAVVFGFVFFGEIPLMQEVVGGTLITLAVLGMNKAELKQ